MKSHLTTIPVLGSKLLLTLSIIAFTLTFANAQNNATEEETINWIMSKYKMYGYNPMAESGEIWTEQELEITSCGLIVTSVFKHKVDGRTAIFGSSISELPFSQLKSLSYTKDANYQHNNGMIVFISKNSGVIERTNLKGAQGKRKGDVIKLYMNNGENDLVARLIKALEHLTKFCDQKEDLF